MRCPYLEVCSKQKWTANAKSFKNPIRHTARCRTCGFSRGSLNIAFLYRRINSIAKISTVLWARMILTVILVIIAGSTHFNPNLAFSFLENAFAPSKFLLGLGDEIKNPGRTLPRAVILSILLVAIIDLSINFGIIGTVPWQEAMKSQNIGTEFMQIVWGKPGAIIITILIIWTCFASLYTGLLGASRLPYNAAVDGLFFKPFAKCTLNSTPLIFGFLYGCHYGHSLFFRFV